MTKAAEDMEFERAAKLRDRIRALAAISMEQSINPETVEEADVFALHVEGGQACVQVFFFRAGQNWGNRAYFPRVNTMVTDSRSEDTAADPPATADRAEIDQASHDAGGAISPTGPAAAESDECGAIMDAFLGQFYEDKPVPRLVLLSHDAPNRELLAEAFCVKSGHRVEIATPKRGEKRELVAHALTNAREALGRRMAEGSAQAKLLSGVAEAFKLDGPPERIEVYDNSHIMGTNAVGGMIVAGPEGFAEDQLPQVQHPRDRPHPRRRLRHDARGAAAPLRPPGQGGGGGRDPAPPRPGAGGRRRRPARRRPDHPARPRRATTSPCVGVAKGPDRDAGLERFFVPGNPRPSCSSPRARCSTTSSACATKPTASPSAPTASSAKPT